MPEEPPPYNDSYELNTPTYPVINNYHHYRRDFAFNCCITLGFVIFFFSGLLLMMSIDLWYTLLTTPNITNYPTSVLTTNKRLPNY